MSILIEGMEMPVDKEVFLRIDEKGEVYVYGSYPTELHKAVHVPPHGDLIDREPFVQFIKTHWDSYDQWFVEQLEARPTIIPADPAEPLEEG